MPISPQNQSKSVVSPNGADKTGVYLWGDVDYNWGDSIALWGGFVISPLNQNKNVISPEGQSKN